MQSTDFSPLTPISPVLWLHVTLSTRLDLEGIQAWRSRLQNFLRSRRLLGAISPGRIAVLLTGALVSSFEHGVLIGWLTAQPEVVFVRIERYRTPVQFIREAAHV